MTENLYLAGATIAILVVGALIVTWAYKELAKGVQNL